MMGAMIAALAMPTTAVRTSMRTAAAMRATAHSRGREVSVPYGS
jgi:hypothetical protein